MGAWEEIVDYTVPSNTTSVVLNNFGTITKDDFIKVHFTHINTLGSSVGTALLPNNSVNNNFHSQVIGGDGSTVFASRFNVQQFTAPRANTTDTTFAYFKLSENDRANIFTNPTLRNDSGLFFHPTYSTSSGATFANGITSLTLSTTTTNGIAANSRIQIYRLAAEKVADITVTSNTTQVDITGLDIQKGSEYLLVGLNKNPLSSGPRGLLYVNGNENNGNYRTQSIVGENTSASSSRQSFPFLFGNQPNKDNVFYSHLKLSNIGAFTWQSYTMFDSGGTAPIIQNWVGSTLAENITSVNQLKVFTDQTNGIGTGSRFELYKLY
jgi:hypothetical protein